MPATVSLKMLAQSLQLSTATVSRALNGYPEVNQATRERVQAQATLLAYRANPTAQRLVTGKTDTVGWVYPSDTSLMGDEQFLNTISGITDALSSAKRDFHIVTARANDEINVYQHIVRSRLVDALVVARCQVVDARIAYLLQMDFPFVAYGRSAHDEGRYSCLDFDHAHAGQLAVTHLQAAGHRHIAYLHDDLNIGYAQGRYQGFLSAMVHAGLPVLAGNQCKGGHSQQSGFDACCQLLNPANKPLALRPTALVVDNAWAGVGALKAIHRLGLQLKHDIAVVVCNGIPDAYAEQFRDISVVHFGDPAAIGQQLAAMVLARLASGRIEQLLWRPTLLGAK